MTPDEQQAFDILKEENSRMRGYLDGVSRIASEGPGGPGWWKFTWEWLGKGMKTRRREWEIVIWTKQVMISKAGAPEKVRCVLFGSVADVPRAFWQCLTEIKGQP